MVAGGERARASHRDRGQPGTCAPAGAPDVPAPLRGARIRRGRWLAYVAEVTRRLEVYVRRLDGAAGEGIQISTNGGGMPCWGKDGRELYYVDDTGNIVVVRFTSFDPLTPGPPEVLFNAHLEEATDKQYDVSRDGKRFILNQTIATGGTPISVVLGWQERLTTK